MSFGIYDKLFILTVSFLSDNASFRLIGKMIAEKCFMKNLKTAYQMLYSVNKEFAKDHGKDIVEDSMRSM